VGSRDVIWTGMGGEDIGEGAMEVKLMEMVGGMCVPLQLYE